MLRNIKAFVLSVTLLIGTAATAGAVIVHADGGTWDHGYGGGTVWSHYFHNGVRHGSTAEGKYRVDSGCVNKNTWSHASAPQAGFFGVNKTFYRHC